MRIMSTQHAGWDRRRQWWFCACGEPLPAAPRRDGGVVSCACGRLWEYGHWALNRWAGDTASTQLQPRRA